MANVFLSLSPYTREKLKVSFEADWTSNNADVSVTNGWITTKVNTGTALIIATEKSPGTRVKTWQVTIVPWSANRLRLDLVETYDQQYIMTAKDGTIYFSVRETGLELFATSDAFKTHTKVCDLPRAQVIAPMLITPNGFFIQSATGVWYTPSLTNPLWVRTVEAAYNGLKSSFDYYFDSATGKTYVYSGEYYTGVDGNHPCKVDRVIVNADGTYTGDVSLQFHSRSEYIADPTLSPVCWHVHIVKVDQGTGHVYVGTGDIEKECSILKSTDNGITWTVIGVGNREFCRTLSIWFTDSFMYWNMDSSNVQHIYRVPKGTTNLYANKETVAIINSGSMWYHLWIKDDYGEDVIIMGTAPEGLRQDDHGRVFYIKEKSDGTVEIEEIFLATTESDVDYYMFRQLEPFVQDAEGYIYCNNRTIVSADYTTRKYRLIRYEDANVITGKTLQ